MNFYCFTNHVYAHVIRKTIENSPKLLTIYLKWKFVPSCGPMSICSIVIRFAFIHSFVNFLQMLKTEETGVAFKLSDYTSRGNTLLGKSRGL